MPRDGHCKRWTSTMAGHADVANTTSGSRRYDYDLGCRTGSSVPSRLYRPRTTARSLAVRGPNVMRGYYRAPEGTAAVVDAEGWFNTGDLARFDGDTLYIVGRSKELIIRSGFNVYPAEVEAVLNEHPAVVQSAVIGRSVAGNEQVVAYIQLLPGSTVKPEDLMAHTARSLAPYKRPSEIIVLDALPAASTGKILKHRLADHRLADTARDRAIEPAIGD